MKYLLILLLSIILYAKETPFSLTVQKPFDRTLFYISKTINQEFEIFAAAKDEKKEANKNIAYTNAFDYLASLHTNGINLIFYRVDANAQIKESKVVNLSNSTKIFSVVKVKSGYFVLTQRDEGNLMLHKLNADASVVAHQSLDIQSNQAKLLSSSDGHIYLLTSSQPKINSNDPFDRGYGLNDINLLKFSSEATLLWSKKYGTKYDDFAIDLTEAKDGSLVILAQSIFEGYKNVTTLRVSSSGDMIWLKQYQNKANTTANRIITLNDGTFLASLTQEGTKAQVKLLKFDASNKMILDKTIQTRYASILKDIKELPSSHIIGIGHVSDKEDTDALVMLFDSKLNMTNQEHFGESEHDSFYTLERFDDTNIICVGTLNDKNSMWIVKLNQNSLKN